MPKRDPKFSAIVAFFRHIAENHHLIKHSDAKPSFFRLEFDEVVAAMPIKAVYPLLVLESYAYNIEDQKSDNVFKKREGAFLIMDKVADIGNYDLIHEKFDLLEEIGNDILARINSDKRKPDSPVRDFNIGSVSALIVTDAGNNTVSIRYTYELNSRFETEVDKTKWLDLNT